MVIVQSELRRSGYEELIPAGVVLTGGTSKMEGAVDLAEEIFHMVEWAHRNTRAACTTLSVIRFMPLRWVCSCICAKGLDSARVRQDVGSKASASRSREAWFARHF